LGRDGEQQQILPTHACTAIPQHHRLKQYMSCAAAVVAVAVAAWLLHCPKLIEQDIDTVRLPSSCCVMEAGPGHNNQAQNSMDRACS
jgi:hypothetical protein